MGCLVTTITTCVSVENNLKYQMKHFIYSKLHELAYSSFSSKVTSILELGTLSAAESCLSPFAVSGDSNS